MKYLFWNLWGKGGKEHISLQQLPLFISANVNLLRWHTGSAFVGGEVSGCLPVSVTHYSSATNSSVKDKEVGRTYVSLAARAGIRFSRWDICLHYAYDLAPAMNQKYVFESAAYDYESLHGSIFERQRFGLSVSYILPY